MARTDSGAAAPSVCRVSEERILHRDGTPAAVRAVTIPVLAVNGAEDLPVGARRRFLVSAHGEGHRVHGDTVVTRQIRKRRERRKLLKDLQHDQ